MAPPVLLLLLMVLDPAVLDPLPAVAVKEDAAAPVEDGSAPTPLVVLGGLLGACLLAGLALLVMGRLGWGEERLAGARHALGEAGFRTGSTWQSFTDWMRFGR